MFFDLNGLLKQVREYLSHNPTDSHLFLDAISDGLKGYAEAQKKDRDMLAYNAIDGLYMLLRYGKDLKEKEYAYIIDSVRHQFPNGWKSSGSNIHREIMESFVVAMDKHDLWESEWIVQVKGCGDYMKSLRDDPETKKVLRKAKRVKTKRKPRKSTAGVGS